MQVVGAVQKLTHASLVGVKVEKRNSKEDVITLTGSDGQTIALNGTPEDLMEMIFGLAELENGHSERVFNRAMSIQR